MITKNEDGTCSATIDGDDYSFTLWSASKSIETLAELSGVAGDFATALSKLFVQTGGIKGEVDPSLAASCMASLTKGISADPKGTLSLVRRLTSDGVLCANKPIVFDAHYKGRTLHLFKVVRAGIEVQYSDFFTAFAGAKGAPSAEQNQASLT